nr:hypothetical protein [Tanacetum cinerariifolium]
MVWRHPNAAIDDLRPAASSFSMAYEEPHHDIRPTFQRLPFYCTPHPTADTIILDPTPADLTVGTPSAKILAKTESSHKRKAFTSGATSSHVAKRTREPGWELCCSR